MIEERKESRNLLLARVEQDRDKWRARAESLSEQLEADRSAVADGVTKALKEIASRSWLTTGRGSYEWDDDRYQEEFGAAADAIVTALEPLRKIAADWTGCPKTSAEVAQARIDWRARAEKSERERDARDISLWCDVCVGKGDMPHCICGGSGSALTARDNLRREVAALRARAERLEAAWKRLQNYRGVTWNDDGKERIGLCYGGDPDMAGCSLDTTYDPVEFIGDLDKWLQEQCRAALKEEKP